MTDTSIREELRRAAMTEDPWHFSSGLAASVASEFCNPMEAVYFAEPSRCRWFFLLVAEAL